MWRISTTSPNTTTTAHLPATGTRCWWWWLGVNFCSECMTCSRADHILAVVQVRWPQTAASGQASFLKKLWPNGRCSKAGRLLEELANRQTPQHGLPAQLSPAVLSSPAFFSSTGTSSSASRSRLRPSTTGSSCSNSTNSNSSRSYH